MARVPPPAPRASSAPAPHSCGRCPPAACRRLHRSGAAGLCASPEHSGPRDTGVPTGSQGGVCEWHHAEACACSRRRGYMGRWASLTSGHWAGSAASAQALRAAGREIVRSEGVAQSGALEPAHVDADPASCTHRPFTVGKVVHGCASVSHR